MLLVAILTVRRAQLDAFRAYEAKAAAIMARHGGVIERALVLDVDADTDADTVRELHIVRFLDESAFEAYRSDAELVGLRDEREACIVATDVWPAREGPRY